MIIKSITSKAPRFKQLLDYLTRDKDKTVNDRGESFVLKRFLNGKTNEEMAREFLLNEEKRLHKRSNNSKLVHEIISFSNLEHNKVTIEHLKVLTEAYLQMRSPLVQAFAIGHFGPESHYHCHIVSSPVDITGRNLRMSKDEFAKAKRDIQVLQTQLYPELSHSIVDHGKKEREKQKGRSQAVTKQKEKTMTIRNPSRISNKAKAREAIESCMIMAESKEHYFELLSELGFQPYQRGSGYKGIDDGERNYRFTSLMNNYAERFESLDQKQERIEDLRDVRSSSEEREQEYEMERVSSEEDARTLEDEFEDIVDSE